jgi:aminotransferase
MNKLTINKNVTLTQPSPIRKVFELALRLESQGNKLIRFDIGSPGYDVPSIVREESVSQISNANYRYISNWGLPGLREQLASELLDKTGINYNFNDEIIITNGASEAVAMAIFTLLDNDEEFLIPTPAWPHYVSCAKLFNKKHRVVETNITNNFKLTAAELLKNISGNSKVLILNTPSNPTGAAYSKDEFDAIYKVCIDHNILIIFDEVYSNLRFDGLKSSVLEGINSKENLLYINSFSKNFGMTGWRVGYIAGSSSITKELIKFHQFVNVCGQAFAQESCLKLLNNKVEKENYSNSILRELITLKEIVTEFKNVNDIEMSLTEGGFYSFIRIPSNYESAEKFCLEILENEHISLIPGNAFGEHYDKYFRLSFGSVSEKSLRDGLVRLLKYYTN